MRVSPYPAFRVQAALAMAVCEELTPPDIQLLERGRAPLLQFDRPPTDRKEREYRGCSAVESRAAESWLGGIPRRNSNHARGAGTP